MTKRRNLDYFLEAEPPADRRQASSDPLPLPTLDERVTFYLNAIHGPREFTGKERAEAHNVLLDTMAANTETLDVPGPDPLPREGMRGQVKAPSNDPLAGLARLIGQSDPFGEYGAAGRPTSRPSADYSDWSNQP